MKSLLERMSEKGIDRRSFLAMSAASVAALGLTGCSNGLSETKQDDKAAMPVTESEWKSAACWSHCGGRCALKALVEDGVITRIKTDDTHEDSFEWPQRRACLRGRSRRKDVYSADRLKYPMKRKGWQPGGGENSHGELRGIDEWERISWDEALDLVAKELQRIKDTYGGRAIFGNKTYEVVGQSIADSQLMNADDVVMKMDEFAAGFIRGEAFGSALHALGGCTEAWTTASAGAFNWANMYGYGSAIGSDFNNDRMDARNCEVAIMFGVNNAYSSDSTSFWANYVATKKAGCRFISIDPMYTDTCAVLDAEWVPIRPGTDVAFLLAMAHVLLTEDDPLTNPLIDWDVIERCTIGFDADHMPEGEDPQGNFTDHVLGTYDGQPKDCEWASTITGVSAEKIREIALLAGMNSKVALLSSWAVSRNHNAEGFVQAFMCVGAMGGHFGRSGHMMASGSADGGLNGGAFLVTPGDRGITTYVKNPVDDQMHGNTLWEDMLAGHYSFTGRNFNGSSEERDIDIHAIYIYARDPIHSNENATAAIAAFRKVDLVVTHAFAFNENALYSDFVLPVITPWEKTPEFSQYMCRETGYYTDHVIDPLYEAKNDLWIGSELCKRWGFEANEVCPDNSAEQSYNQLASVNVATSATEYAPLLSFAEEDAVDFGQNFEPRAEGVISYQEFKKTGVYNVPRSKDDDFGSIAYQAFREDPEGNPMGSESGKFEFYCRQAPLLTTARKYSVTPPVPTYIPSPGGYESTFSDQANGVKGTCPFQIYTPHYLRSSHYHFENIPWLREAFARPVYINSQDAVELGIEEGDTVVVANEHGSMQRNACVTGRIMPGVVAIPHGGMIDYDEKAKSSLGGCDNIITAPVSTGMGTSGYNTQICNVEKWTGEALLPDVDRPCVAPGCQNEE